MEWTVEIITALCVEYCARCGVEFNAPVAINPALTRTLGRCFIQSAFNTDFWRPYKMEFSQILLETGTDQCIKDVIMHECAHYVATYKTNKNHGHDAIFKAYCAQIGTTNDGTQFFNFERKPDVKMDAVWRYTLYCEKCGSFLGGKSRNSKTLQNIHQYHSTCCHAPIILKKNW